MVEAPTAVFDPSFVLHAICSNTIVEHDHEVIPTKEHIAQMRKDELRLRRRSGLRVHVDKLTADKAHVLCTAWRTAPELFQSRMDDHEIVDLVHEALRSLHVLGLRPLVGVIRKRSMAVVPPILKTDPFHLIAAIGEAEEARRSDSITPDEADRRAALLTARKDVDRSIIK